MINQGNMPFTVDAGFADYIWYKLSVFMTRLFYSHVMPNLIQRLGHHLYTPYLGTKLCPGWTRMSNKP